MVRVPGNDTRPAERQHMDGWGDGWIDQQTLWIRRVNDNIRYVMTPDDGFKNVDVRAQHCVSKAHC